MAIRVPQNPAYGVNDIRSKIGSDNNSVKRLLAKRNGIMSIIWKYDSGGITSTFLDCNGEIFFDVNGVPFQGSD